MIVGDKGPLTQSQVDKMQADAAETKRVRTLSDSNIIGEIRARMSPANLLGVAVGIGIIALLNTDLIKTGKGRPQQILPGNDPYCLSKPRRPKMGRMRKGKVATRPVASKAAVEAVEEAA